MKKMLLPTILSLIFLAQANLATAESVAFNLSVTIPVRIAMNTAALPAQNSTAPTTVSAQADQVTVQEQQLVRGRELVTVRSIVAL